MPQIRILPLVYMETCEPISLSCPSFDLRSQCACVLLPLSPSTPSGASLRACTWLVPCKVDVEVSSGFFLKLFNLCVHPQQAVRSLRSSTG
jgi:hypothetical protein